MVCLGNICRSPAAEAVLRARASDRDLDVIVQSCGTGGGSGNWAEPGGVAFHEGECADKRMSSAALKRGIKIDSRSRPLAPEDIEGDNKFDVVIGMDESNVRAMEMAREIWIAGGRCGDEARLMKWSLMADFSPETNGFRGKPVPDPYYLGVEGFETALDLIQGAADGVLDCLFGEDEKGTKEWTTKGI